MTIVGIVYLCALLILAGGLASAPDHSFRGTLATIDIFALFISGTILAVRTLS